MAGTVTAIRVQKKNPRRANLYLDGEFALGLAVEVVQDFGLHRGQVLSAADLEALQAAEKRHQAYREALRLLSYRPRSVYEVRTRLAGRGYDAALVEATVARLQELGLLDDRAFARAWVESRESTRPRGRQALAAELRQKGVSAEVIAGVLDEVLAEDESALALEMARVRARSLRGLERPAFFRRLQGFLVRRGFSADVVLQVVRQVWEEVQNS